MKKWNTYNFANVILWVRHILCGSSHSIQYSSLRKEGSTCERLTECVRRSFKVHIYFSFDAIVSWMPMECFYWVYVLVYLTELINPSRSKSVFSSICSFAVFRLWRKMLTTKIINGSGCSLELKESNAGVFSKIGQLKHGASFTISIDANATYREYIIGPPSHPLIITSDDIRLSEVIKVNSKKGELIMEPTLRNSLKTLAKSYFWSEFQKLFQKVIGQERR